MGKCVYCSSTNYGTGCLFSPTKVHMHMDEPDKCIYCGSKNDGYGCPYNPYGKVHVKGFALLQKVKEQCEITMKTLILNEVLNQKNDKQYKSPLDRFYKRLSDIIKNSGQPLLEALKISETSVHQKINSEEVLELKSRLQDQILEMKRTLRSVNYHLPPEEVEKIILEVILSEND